MKKLLTTFLLTAELLGNVCWADGRDPAIVENPSNPYVQGASQLTEEEIAERNNLAYVLGGGGVLLTVLSKGFSPKVILKKYNQSWSGVSSALNNLGNLSTEYEAVLNSGNAYDHCRPILEKIEGAQVKLRASKVFSNHEKLIERMRAKGFEPSNSIYEQYSATKPIDFINWNLPANKKAARGSFAGRSISGILATAGALLITIEGNVLVMSFGFDQYPDQEKIYHDLKDNMGLLADPKTWEKVKGEIKRALEQKKSQLNSGEEDLDPNLTPKGDDLFEIDPSFKNPEKAP